MPGLGHSMAPRAFVATPDDAPGFWQLGNLWRVMASGILTGNAFCLIDQLVTPDGGGAQSSSVASGSCSSRA